MRIAALALLALTGCTVVANDLRRPYVDLSIDSQKTASAFAQCASQALSAELLNDGAPYWIIRKNSLGVHVARWDFHPTLTGSRAELRSGTERMDIGEAAVRACA
jgi:hypothetical protein